MENINGQEMDAHDRVEHLIKKLGKNPNSFSDAIGVQSSQIYHIVRGNSGHEKKKTKPSFDLLTKICEAFPQVNFTWLFTGKGSVFLNQESDTVTEKIDSFFESKVSEDLIEELREELKNKRNTEKVLLETISNLSKR